jgi:hypothetical protein
MIFTFVVSAFLIQASESPKNILTERIEVRVGTEIISTSDIEIMAENIRPSMNNASEAQVLQKARDMRVDEKLMLIYLRKNEMEAAIDNEVEKRMAALSADKNFGAMLASKNLTMDRFRDGMKLQFAKSQFMNLLRRNVSRNPDENDLKTYFKNMPENAKKNFEIELSECFIPFGDNPKEARTRAEFFLNSPKKFPDCVKNLSQSQSTSRAGKIGTFNWGVLPEEIEARVSHLKAGEIAIVPRPDGIQLLKVEKTKVIGPITFDVAKERIREHIESEILEQEYTKTLADLRANTFIKIES